MSASTAVRPDPEVNGSTLRSRRRRERLRNAGLRSATYALDHQVADAIEVAAKRLGVEPGIYLTRLVLPDLMKLGVVGRLGDAIDNAKNGEEP